MNIKIITLFLVIILGVSCDSKDSSKKADEQKAATPIINVPEVPDEPNETPEEPTSEISPDAEKVSLWNRTSGYDCAVFLPADYGKYPNKMYPMILSLHGYSGSVLNIAHTAVGGEKTGFIKQVWSTALAKKYPAIVIAPNWAPAGSSSSGLWEHSQLRQLILDAMKKYNVDPDRIVATGLSAGSIGTQDLIRNSKDLLAGAMPGAYATQFSGNPCQLADIPIWVFGNTSDTLFKANGWQSVEPNIQACANYNHEFKLTVYENTCGHGCWDSHWAKPEVQEWLISQER